MQRSKRSNGSQRERFVVTGPDKEDHPVPSVGAGLSVALDFAREDRKLPEERSYYVRDPLGILCAMVTKGSDGVHRTTVVT